MATSPEYKPGQTFADYVAAQKAAFIPEAIAATQDSYIGDENRTEFIPGQAASQSTFNENPIASGDYGKWYAAQEKEALKYLPQGWSGGSMGRSQDYTESGGWGEGPEIYLPGTGPTGNWSDTTTAENMVAPNMAYRLLSQDKNGNQVYEVQEYGPNGLVGKPTTVRQGLGDDGLFGLLIQAGMAGVLGPLAGQLGALAAPGLGAGAQMAIGQGLVGAGKTAAMGGDLGDALTSGLTSGATSFIGSTVGDALPKGVAPTGIQSLDTALTKGMQSAAGSGVTSLLTGNKNILQDALIAGAGAAAGSGANSVISDAAGSTGLPPAALNIIGPAAIAELMGKDPTGAALKAAVGEITGAIKGSSAGQKDASVAAPKDLMGGITDSGEYLQEDGSVLSVTKSATTGKLSGRLYPRDEVAQDQYQQEIAPFLNQALPSIRPEDKSYIEDNLAKGVSADSLIAALVAGGRSPEEAQNIFIDATGNLPNQPKTTENLPFDYGLDFGAFAERPDTSADTTPKVEVTGQTPDTELMRFLEANGLTSDEAQKVLITGKDQDAGTDYNKFFELSPEGTPTPKVVVQGQTPPKDTAVDDLMALLGPYDTQLDNTQRVDITGNTPKEGVSTDLPSAFVEPTTDDTQEANRVEITAKKLLQDMGLDLGDYYPGDEQTETPTDKLTDTKTQTVPITGTKVKEELDPNFFYQPDEVAPDKLTDDLTQEVEITGKTPPITLPDYSSLENVPEEFPFIYPGEETPPEVNEPGVEPVEPVKPVVKPIVDPKRPVTPVSPVAPTTPSYTIPGTTTQLHQELMQLPETDILRMLNPALYAYKDAQKRKKLSQEDQMTALLNELGYRS